MPIEVVNGPVIEAGESLSDAVDLSAGRIVRLTTPFEWTEAGISFEVSTDGNGFNPLYESDGQLVFLPCGPARAILMTWPAFVESLMWIKIRSGTHDDPVVQPARREFAVAIKVPVPNAFGVRVDG